jgi:hypothetical protein
LRSGIIGLAAALALAAGMGATAHAQEGPGGEPGGEPASPPPKPRLKGPSFPLEPGKKDTVPVRPETYVEAKDEPPGPPETAIPRYWKSDGEWWNTFDVGWFHGSGSANHTLAGPGVVDGKRGILRNGSSLLNGFARLRARPPGFLPVSFAFSVAGSSGNADCKAENVDIAITSFGATDLRALGGLRIHFLRRTSRWDLIAGADAQWASSSFPVLNAARDAISVETRTRVTAIPRATLRYARTNWHFEGSYGYGILLRSTAPGGGQAEAYRAHEAEAGVSRYFGIGEGVGLEVAYLRERARWTTGDLVDDAETREVRMRLFYRLDF